jgi:hypothetical protein
MCYTVTEKSAWILCTYYAIRNWKLEHSCNSVIHLYTVHTCPCLVLCSWVLTCIAGICLALLSEKICSEVCVQYYIYYIIPFPSVNYIHVRQVSCYIVFYNLAKLWQHVLEVIWRGGRSVNYTSVRHQYWIK